MILDTVKRYEDEATQITALLSDTLDAEQTALLYGSVSRAFGPFSDIDIITFGPNRQLPARFCNSTPVQEHVFTKADIEDYLVNSPRGQHTLIDGILIHPDSDSYADVVQLHHERSLHLATEGRADFLALMLAEQRGDTARPDIRHNKTHYALKRSFGGKRAYTRSYSMAQMLLDPPITGGAPHERIVRLLDTGMIEEQDIEAIYAMNALLFRAHTILPNDKEWQQASSATAEWNEKIANAAKRAIATMLDTDYITQLDGSLSTSAGEQSHSIYYAEQDSTSEIRSRTLLWNLMSNPSVTPEVLHRAWSLAERQPRQLRDLGCCAVQLPQFQELDVDPSSELLNDPDVQFSLHWSAHS